MRLLVTGGLGHIGSELIRHGSASRGVERVVVVDDTSSERFCSLFDLPSTSSLKFRLAPVGSLTPADLEGIDAVVHLAAQTDATASLDQRDRVFANNLGATRHVVDLVSAAGCRLVFASTTSVYGSQAARVDEACIELRPQSPYAECKLEEETLIADARAWGLDAVVLRLGTIAGPSAGMRFHTAVNKFCLQAALGEPLSVWRTAWEQRRPYLDLQDAVRALLWAASASLPEQSAIDRVFNIVTENLTVQDIVTHVEAAFGPLTVNFTESRIMNQLSYEVSTDRVHELGFWEEGSIGEAIRLTSQLLRGVSGVR